MATTALGLSTINGLPAHVLIVHLVVIFVPLSGIALIAASLRAGAARRLGVWLPVMAGVAFVSILAAMNAGGWLENHVNDTALVHRHTEMAGQLWPFSAAVLLLSLAVWWLRGRGPGDRTEPGPDGTRAQRGSSSRDALIAVLCVLFALGSFIEVYRIGDSGARASWHDNYSTTATTHGGD